MNTEPLEWSVVIVGYWNRAILTPAGIAYRLFKKPKETPVQVEIPLDGIAPYRVKDDSIVVMAQHRKLQIITQESNFENLEKALKIAEIALTELPETPVNAAGFNIVYKIHDITDILLRYISSEIDEIISDANYKINSRSLARSINWNKGLINLEINHEENNTVISLNFEKKSNEIKDLIQWVKIPVKEIEKTSFCILNEILKIPLEEIKNEPN